MYTLRFLLFLALPVFFISWNSAPDACSCHATNSDSEDSFCRDTNLQFIENKGQWHNNIQYRCALGGLNSVFLEDNGFTYVIYDSHQTGELHDVMKVSEEEKDAHFVHGHRYSVQFLNALNPTFSEFNKRDAYNNYFLGDDPEKWASKVGVFNKIQYEQLYTNIQLSTYGDFGEFKYDFIVNPGGNPSDIQLAYDGQDDLYLKGGDLIIETSVIQLREMAPYAYQIVDGKQKKVPCIYTLHDNILGFSFPESYNPNIPLIIDPTVVGATLTGTVGSTNFGHSAAYDNEGNMYVAGISFGVGYPTTDGAFQENFIDSYIDIVVSKYNEDGTALIYATYIGGEGSEYPHSIITNVHGQLYIYGSSGSTNYPTTSNAFQPTYAGNYDIVVSLLSKDGDALIGSTFIGGSQSDGLNEANIIYVDLHRGEIVLDENSNVYIASGSRSDDFPISANAFQNTFNASLPNSQDGVLLKLNSDLSVLYWSTYLGGEGADMCYGIRVDEEGNVYTSGFAGGQNFPMFPTGAQSAWPGGDKSAFVVKMSSDGSTMLAGTYWGTSSVDEGTFVELDEDGVVHMYGVTLGTLPITPDTYFHNAGSHQFIVGFTSDLNTVEYSTVIGLGPNSTGNLIFNPFDFVPVAFMVDQCKNIYISGYYSQYDLPVTDDAVHTDGNSFYLVALSPLAKELTFATYYGEANHVDGGTSRFDKAGIIYQGVCSCISINDESSGGVMNTTPNAWATSQTGNCDAGVFKIDFNINIVTAVAFAEPASSGCVPFDLDLHYSGQDAVSVFWDFGNGDTSEGFTTQYTYTEAGTYIVTQIAENLSSCNVLDTFYMEVIVLDNSSSVQEITLCGPTNIFLDATTYDATYEWNTSEDQATIEVSEAGIYWVDISILGCSRRDSFIVSFISEDVDLLEPSYALCDQEDITLDVTNSDADTYIWSDGTEGPINNISDSGIYAVTVSFLGGCEVIDSVNVTLGETPIIDLGENVVLCPGQSVLLDVPLSGVFVEWQDGSSDEDFLVTEAGIYAVTVSNIDGCESNDVIEVSFYEELVIDLGENTVNCIGEEIILNAQSPGLEVLWQDGSVGQELIVTESGNYSVTVTTAEGCDFIDEIEVSFIEIPIIDLGEDLALCEGEMINLSANFPEWEVIWQDGSNEVEYIVTESGLYSVTITNGACESMASVAVVSNPNPEVTYSTSNNLCAGDNNGEIVSTSTSGGSTFDYVWNSGEETGDLENLLAGTYSVTIVNEFGCVSQQEIEILEPLPIEFEILAEDLYCDSTSRGRISIENIQGGVNPFTFTSVGDSTITNSVFENLLPGTYEIIVEDANGCSVTENITIADFVEISIDAGDDKSILLSETTSLDGFATDLTNMIIEWNPDYNLSCNDCLIPDASPEFDTEYILTITDTLNGCIYMDTVNVRVDRNRDIYIPNVFSPNNDGVNDYFTVFGGKSLRMIHELHIYDRWGERIYFSKNILPNEPTLGWDGTFNGRSLNPQVLAYLVEVEFIDGSTTIFHGDLSIIK